MAERICVTCKETKQVPDFAWRWRKKGIRHISCRGCQSRQRKDWYARNRERHITNVRENRLRAVAAGQQYIWDYLLAHPCRDCGENDPIVLEFDHVRGTKRMAVGELARQGYSLAAIRAEIAKCEVRCANCHRRKTHREFDWFRGRDESGVK